MWKYQDQYYYKTLMDKEHYQALVEERVCNNGVHDLLKDKQFVCGYYIVKGSIKLYDQVFHQDTLIWIKDGNEWNVEIEANTKLIYIETLVSLPHESLDFDVYEDRSIPWSRPLQEGMTASRHMIKAEDYGVKIQTCIYTNNFTHLWHTHKAAHGFYVLDGMLQYDFDDGRKGIYGPGEFVVSQGGENILHVQAPHSCYCKYLFIGDGLFDFIVDGVDLYNK